MLLSRSVVGISALGLLTISSGAVFGDDFPNKPIRIVTAGAGGSNDFLSRQIAQGITGALGQSIIVENRPTGFANAEIVSKASPDGYTLLGAGGTFWTTPLLQKTPYDAVRDFSSVTLASRSPNVLVVSPLLPVNSVKDLIALAKAKPGELNYASNPPGSPSHLAAELFNQMAGVKITRIVYKSGAETLADLIANRVQMMINDAPTVMPIVKSGKLKALAVTTADPSPLAPDLPTMIASGLPGYEGAQLGGIFAPAKTPQPVIKRLNSEMVRYLTRPDVKEIFLARGSEAVGSTPEELTTTMKAEIARMGKLINDLGIRPN